MQLGGAAERLGRLLELGGGPLDVWRPFDGRQASAGSATP